LHWVFEAKKRFGLCVLDYVVTSNHIHHLVKDTGSNVTQPQIAEVVVVAPDQLLINGKAVGRTSLVVWFEEKTKARKQ
jgi:Flp pilus assembly secretin CpaC